MPGVPRFVNGTTGKWRGCERFTDIQTRLGQQAQKWLDLTITMGTDYLALGVQDVAVLLVRWQAIRLKELGVGHQTVEVVRKLHIDPAKISQRMEQVDQLLIEHRQ